MSKTTTKKKVAVVRAYKDRVFRKLFNNPENLLSLYNAVNETDYNNPEDLVINTLEDAIYLGMKNDISFLLDLRLSLYEQQASVNPNMPLRNLLYVAELYEGIIADQAIYSSKLILLPTPKFVVFYNGVHVQPEKQILKLSDSFEVDNEEVNLELVTTVYNINSGYNEDVKRRCPMLYEYMEYVECVRTYSKEYELEEAVPLAVDECISKNILRDFLIKNKAEVVAMSIYEYDEEKHADTLRKEGYEDGLKRGQELGLKQGQELGLMQGIEALILDNLEEEISEERIMLKLIKRFQLTEKEAKQYFEQVKATKNQKNN